MNHFSDLKFPLKIKIKKRFSSNTFRSKIVVRMYFWQNIFARLGLKLTIPWNHFLFYFAIDSTKNVDKINRDSKLDNESTIAATIYAQGFTINHKSPFSIW